MLTPRPGHIVAPWLGVAQERRRVLDVPLFLSLHGDLVMLRSQDQVFGVGTTLNRSLPCHARSLLVYLPWVERPERVELGFLGFLRTIVNNKTLFTLTGGLWLGFFFLSF